MNESLCMTPYLIFSANTTTPDTCQRSFPGKNSRDRNNCTVKEDLTEFELDPVPEQ